MDLADIKVRGERIALLAQFIDTLEPGQAMKFLCNLGTQRIISDNAVSLLAEHVRERAD